MGAQIGGGVSAIARDREQELRNLINNWQGQYTDVIDEFAFLLRIDGPISKYTEIFGIVGAQPAKRKRNWIEVEIGIPEEWYLVNDGRNYKRHLVEELEKGLHSMIAFLKRKNRQINDEALLDDWLLVKHEYLGFM